MKKFILFITAFFAVNSIYLQAQTTYTFNYTGASQTLALSPGSYSVQCWGANGGTSAGGKGGYSTGLLLVSSPTTLYIYVGGVGGTSNVTGSSNAIGGWNGGGNGSCYSSYGTSGGGGGGTDIRTTQNSTYLNRVVVAGGGGGGSVGTYGFSGGVGGGTSGGLATAYSGYWAGKGGTQSGGGAGTTESNSTIGSGSLGIGGSHVTTAAGNGWVGCGGGGGYYGGSAGGAVHSGGGGGSGYVGGLSSGSTYVSGAAGFVTNPVSTGHGLVIIKDNIGLSIGQTSPVVCNGQLTAALSATVTGGVAPYTYSWSTGATTSSIGGLGAGTYTCWAVSSTAVTYSGTIVITQPPPINSYINTQYNVFCNGGSDGYLSVYALGGATPYSYTWSPFGGNQSWASGLSAGNYSCFIGDANGCVSTVTALVTQPSAPSIIAFATSSAVCAGQNVTLIGGGSVQGYTWTNGVTNGVPFTPTATANYVVTGFDYNGCPGYAQTSVIVNPTPTVSAAGTASICPGNSVTLTAFGANSYVWTSGATSSAAVVSPTTTTIYSVTGTNTFACQNTATVSVGVYTSNVISATLSKSVVCSGGTITMTGNGAISYTWSGGITNGTPFAPSSSAVYTMSAMDYNTCIKTSTYAVVVNPLPVLTVSGNTAICQGETINLAVSGANSYTWNTGAQTNTLTISPTVNTLVIVNATDANGCKNTSSVNLAVTPLPLVTITSSGNYLCFGRSMTLLAGGATSYTWLPSQQSGVSISVNPTVTTSYTLIGGANGCVNTAPLTLSVVPLPTISVSGPTAVVCGLTPVTLSVSGAASYSWSTGAITSTISVSPSATTLYSVTGTGTNSCSKMDTISVQVKPAPVLMVSNADTVVCADHPATLTVSGALSYTWSTQDTAQTIVVNPPVTTTYTVSGTGSNGCLNSTSYLLVITSCDGINELSGAGDAILVYPNPSDGLLHIKSPFSLQMLLVNELGEIVQKIELSQNNNHTIDLSHLGSGIYFLVGTGSGKNIKEKVVITN